MAVAFRNAMVGMLAMMGLWFTAFLFMGTFLPEDFVVMPLRLICDIMPLKWTAQALSFNIFHGTHWNGAILNQTNPNGFSCPELELRNEEYLCAGATGAQVLAGLSKIFSNVSPGDSRVKSTIYVFVIGVVFKILHVVLVLVKSRQVSTILVEEQGKSVSMA